jgi:hypothetical protein
MKNVTSFTVKMNGKKSAVVSKINAFKGFYGAIRAMNGQTKLFKLISAREYKKDPNKISISILVKPSRGVVSTNKWQMVRVYKDVSGDMIFTTTTGCKNWGIL